MYEILLDVPPWTKILAPPFLAPPNIRAQETPWVQCTGDMPIRVAPCLRAWRLLSMTFARRRPTQSFFLSFVLSYSPYQLLLTIAHNCCHQILCAISRCSPVCLVESASRCDPHSRSLPPRRSRCRCVLSSVDGRSIFQSLKPPLIHSSQITVLSAIYWYYSITLYSDWFLGKHSAW